MFHSVQSITAPIHCQFSLIQYLKTQSLNSKLNCAPFTLPQQKRTRNRKNESEIDIYQTSTSISDSFTVGTTSQKQFTNSTGVESSTYTNPDPSFKPKYRVHHSTIDPTANVRLSLVELAEAEKPQQKKEKKRSWREIEAEFDSWNTVSPFHYLGVFKLSCRACSMSIQVLNDQGGSRFHTRGTHGNWYWLWGLPTLKEDSLTIYIVKEIRKSYHRHCRAQGRLKTLPDRSTTDTDSIRLLNPIAESLFTANFSMPPG